MNSLFILLQKLVPHHLLSRIAGSFADSKVVWFKNLLIKVFITIYNVDMSESSRQDPNSFKNFNDFFTRELKEDARSIQGDITSPADGTVSALGRIEHNQIFQAKGLNYSLEKLLARPDVGDYVNGSFVTIYLAPSNYHRVHSPVDGSLTVSCYIPGKLFSVNQVTANSIPDLFADNERLVCDMATNNGSVNIIMVGAMIVAGIKSAWREESYAPEFSAQSHMRVPYNLRKVTNSANFILDRRWYCFSSKTLTGW